MKSKVLDRPMFMDVENVGIMQGFKDESEDEGYETGAMINRMPDSPEILMNNLRGDMRSVDARVEELASLVGEDVAMDTPPEILAMLQPVLAAQSGIGSLPAGMPPPMGSPPSAPVEAAMPAPEMGMMPPDMGAMPPPEMGAMPPDMGMPPPDMGGMPPQGMPEPINMAEGGYVQSFQAGSDEGGVTPARPSPPVDPYSAQALLQQLDARRDPRALRSSYAELMPLYQEALGGGDRSASQSQMLFDIAQAGLNLAAGTDSKGKRVAPGASFASSLAAAAQGLPERIGARVGLMEQQEQGTRLAALKGAQEQTSAQRSLEEGVLSSYALADRKARDDRSLAAASAAASAQEADIAFNRSVELAKNKADLDLRNDIVTASRESSGGSYGAGKEYLNVLLRSNGELLKRWSVNDVTPLEEREIQIALGLAYGPKTVEIPDPNTGESITQVYYPPVEEDIQKMMDARGYEIGAPRIVDPEDIRPQEAEKFNPMRLQEPERVTQPGTDEPVVSSEVEGEVGKPVVRTMGGGPGAPGTIADAYAPVGPSFYNLAPDATGFTNVSRAWLARMPILGEVFTAEKQIPAQQYMKAAINRVVGGLAETVRYGFLEKKQMLIDLSIIPQLFDQPDALRLAVIGLDNSLLQATTELAYTAQDPNVPASERRAARIKIKDLRGIRNILGVPPRVYGEEDFARLPIGSPYLINSQVQPPKKRELN